MYHARLRKLLTTIRKVVVSANSLRMLEKTSYVEPHPPFPQGVCFKIVPTMTYRLATSLLRHPPTSPATVVRRLGLMSRGWGECLVRCMIFIVALTASKLLGTSVRLLWWSLRPLITDSR